MLICGFLTTRHKQKATDIYSDAFSPSELKFLNETPFGITGIPCTQHYASLSKHADDETINKVIRERVNFIRNYNVLNAKRVIWRNFKIWCESIHNMEQQVKSYMVTPIKVAGRVQ
jgi:hypothetical protein